ncbi:hypothetical protein F4778DRAFT_743722 [Xylariomycetidae sp. FL2044]|nr:hypothetical protein F4778DRAFT_743722 [Xylariomycetidae sp. FL2044]
MTFSPPNMASDDLAALFSRNMTFQQQPVQQPPQEPPKPQEPAPVPEPEIKYSITQHYHHSAHIARDEPPQAEPQRRSSEPPQTQQPSAEFILSTHGVDPTALSAAQMELFKTAEDPQKLRLIELWRICPPTMDPQTNSSVAWANTTLEQEEFFAQMRYHQKLEEEREKNSTIMSMDGTPLTPVQTEEGHWISTAYVEPYMMSGYEALARREYEESAKRQLEEAMAQPKDHYNHFGSAVAGGGAPYQPSTDPVYDNDWARRQQAMEDQYGAFRQMEEMEL